MMKRVKGKGVRIGGDGKGGRRFSLEDRGEEEVA